MTDSQIIVTESLARRVRELQGQRNDPSLMLRVMVNSGGCQGFEYSFDFTAAAEPEDLVIERDGIRVLIDDVSVGFLQGSEIDFVDELAGSSFRVRNPNAKSSCGCGVSFSVGS